MAMMVWIISSPRSGSSFLCDYIGKYTDKKYNEPFQTHPIETPRLWKFPDVDTIVFKYCENWRSIHVLTNLYPNSIYVHIWRNPNDVVYSMFNPKPDSIPPRNLYGGYEGDDRLRLCMQRWYSNMMHCLSLYNIIPKQYIEIRYEHMELGLELLSKATDLKFNLDELGFKNRNIEPELNWDLNPAAKNLRNLVKKFDGTHLAEWVNKKRPKLLQRVVL